MSLFSRFFSKKGLVTGANRGLSEYEEVAALLADRACSSPASVAFEEIALKIANKENRDVFSSRLRFGFSIANEVINIWLINMQIVNTVSSKKLIDLLHKAYFDRQDRKTITIGNYILESNEISEVRRYMEAAIGEALPCINDISTNWWSLMDMVYLSRQSEYYKALQSALESENNGNREDFSPTGFLSIKLSGHLTGITTVPVKYNPEYLALYMLISELDTHLKSYYFQTWQTVDGFLHV